MSSARRVKLHEDEAGAKTLIHGEGAGEAAANLPATPPYLSATPRRWAAPRRWASHRRWVSSARRVELCEDQAGAKVLIDGEGGGEAAATAVEAGHRRAVRWAVGALVVMAAGALLTLAALRLDMAPDEVGQTLALTPNLSPNP